MSHIYIVVENNSMAFEFDNHDNIGVTPCLDKAKRTMDNAIQAVDMNEIEYSDYCFYIQKWNIYTQVCETIISQTLSFEPEKMEDFQHQDCMSYIDIDEDMASLGGFKSAIKQSKFFKQSLNLENL